MDLIIALGGLFFIHMVALISPGPNVLIVTQTAMHGGRQKGVFVSFGLATGAAIWSSATLIGLNTVFEYVTWLYWALKTVGGVYLIL
jgi:threonine efflux protein